MGGTVGFPTPQRSGVGGWRITVASRSEISGLPCWMQAFADQRKDHRHFELVEDTIAGFDHRYFVITDERGDIRAIQPFFLLDQDLVEATGDTSRALANGIRRIWPRFMRLRTLMVGCVAGEGHLDRADAATVRLLASTLVAQARRLNAGLVVLKEFPTGYRGILQRFVTNGYARVPSFPMTRLDIAYAGFEDYMVKALSRRTRRDLRLKFKKAESGAPITLTIMRDITPVIDEAYPLYRAVYDRSNYHFELLTKAYLCRLGQAMPDKVRFFVWRREGRIVAFTVCMLQGKDFFAEYIGLDYALALDLHLYHYAVRDMVTWAIANGYTCFCSSSLNYDPKFHLRCRLDPIDLYVRATSPAVNAALKWLLRWINPVHRDATLKRFPNYHELWAAKTPRRAGLGTRAPNFSVKSLVVARRLIGLFVG